MYKIQIDACVFLIYRPINSFYHLLFCTKVLVFDILFFDLSIIEGFYMHKLHFKNKLFLYFSLITLIITSIISFIFCKLSVDNLLKAQLKNSYQIATSLSTQIDNMFKPLEIAATTLSNTPQLAPIIYELNQDEMIASYDLLQFENIIMQNLNSVLFYLNYVSDVLLFNSEKPYFYYTGLFIENNAYFLNQLNNLSYYHEFLKQDSPFTILPPHENPWKENSAPIISLIKPFQTVSHKETALIEIQIPYNYLDTLLTSPPFNEDYSIVLLDENFNVIYPFDLAESMIDDALLHTIKKNIDEGIFSDYINRHLYNLVPSEYTGWHTLLIQDGRFIENQINYSILSNLLLTIVILGIILCVLMLVLTKLTSPLNKLISHINSSTVHDLNLRVFSDHINEFTMLNDTFDDLYIRLKDSIDQLYETELRETHAQFAALQAQINPHFLYNTLNAISAASEVYGAHTTPIMCQQLANMMRYITESGAITLLNDELLHTRNYLELMRVPNEGLFTYKIDIPIELSCTTIPKLIIQPIVENSFKHAFKEIRPPWEIHIKARIISYTEWSLTIQDNGPGFSKEALDDITTFIASYPYLKHSKLEMPLMIEGMGLKNIFARTFMYFNNECLIKVQNLDAGSSITFIIPITS